LNRLAAAEPLPGIHSGPRPATPLTPQPPRRRGRHRGRGKR
jgi:hypothetical protein